MKRNTLLVLPALFLAVGSLMADESGWPREATTEGFRVVMYQPQVEALTANDIEARAAVSVQGPDSEEPRFGAVWIAARVAVDRDQRIVTFDDIRIPKVRFPEASEENQQRLARFLEREMPRWQIEVDLDLLIPMLELAETDPPRQAGLVNDPPAIVIRREPTILVVVDGEPRLIPVDEPAPAAEARLERVANTPVTLVFDPAARRFFLAGGGDLWYRADEALGPWEPTSEVPDAVLSLIEPAAEDEAPADAGKPPEVLVATVPTELVIVTGPTAYLPVGEVDLLTVSNADREILVDMKSRDHFLLLSGRWYRSLGGLEGPWSYVAPDELPTSFAQIPADSELGHVLAHVPGTVEAREALLDATIPQTSAIRRDDHSFEAEYDGEPRFEPVEGQAARWAVNSPQAVFAVADRFFACEEGVWYEASSPQGPWSVAVAVPEVLYGIPASNPHHNVTYVRVYDVTPEVVYVGYTPGYLGSYVYRGCVVYGTGWTYPGWWGRRYYPRPRTWGFHVTFNPWHGWGFGVSWSSGPLSVSIGTGGWRPGWRWHGWWGPGGWRPYDPPGFLPRPPGWRPPYYPGWRPPQYGPPGSRPPGGRPGRPIQLPATRPGAPAQVPAAGPGGRPTTRDNIYSRDRNALRNAPPPPATRERVRPEPATRPNDTFTDRSGNVYRGDGEGWNRHQDGAWRPVPSRPEARPVPSRPEARPAPRPSDRGLGSVPQRDRSLRSRGRERSLQGPAGATRRGGRG